MGVCKTVALLAKTVETIKLPINSRHKLLIQLLKLIPLYKEIRALDEWETACQGVLEDQDDTSEIGSLLWEVFEFGRYNLYAAFDATGTAACYNNLVKHFENHNIKIPMWDSELDEW